MNKVLSNLFTVVFTLLPAGLVKKPLLSLLNDIEKAVKESGTVVDDIIVLPAIEYLRKELNLQ